MRNLSKIKPKNKECTKEFKCLLKALKTYSEMCFLITETVNIRKERIRHLFCWNDEPTDRELELIRMVAHLGNPKKNELSKYCTLFRRSSKEQIENNLIKNLGLIKEN